MQAWGALEAGEGNIELARQLFKCAVKADPYSEISWLVSVRHPASGCPGLGDICQVLEGCCKSRCCLLQLRATEKGSRCRHVHITH